MANNIAYFQSPGIELGKALYSNGSALVKRAIVAIEGTHRCNRGKTYNMPAEYIRELADNTNQEIANGREIPLFRNHEKSAENKFGRLTGLVECRRIVADDIPDPAATGMIGRMAIFANANITDCIDLVKSTAIKSLSPGIDVARKLIFEVSAVPIASMPGVAFFSYEEIKAQKLKYLDLRDMAIDALDTLIETMRSSDNAQADQLGADLNYRQASFMSFVEDLREIFEVQPSEDEGDEGSTYSDNPYADRVVRQEFGSDYSLNSQQKNSVLNETSSALEVLSKPTLQGDRRSGSRRSRGNPRIGGLTQRARGG